VRRKRGSLSLKKIIMSDIIIQPYSVYIGLAITGIFTGMGVAIVVVVVEYWIKPYINKLNALHEKYVLKAKK
jgi:hypothetical protein